MEVSIIIVNYNTKDLTVNCIKSIKKYTKNIEYEVIVSDNGSIDNSVNTIREHFPDVIIVENNENLGFGTANNRALKYAKGKYIFYLNSDTELRNNAVKLFYDYYEKNKINENLGAIGCNLLKSDLTINHSFGNFPNVNNIINDLIHANYGLFKLFILNKKNYHSIPVKNNCYSKYIGQVDYIIGADLFLENNKYAYFDERYFLYCEEVDLQYKLYLESKNRIIIDGPEIIHFDGQSSKKTQDIGFPELTKFSSQCNNISRVQFIKKNCSFFKGEIIKLLTLLLWLNPLIFKYNKKSLKKLLKA